MREHPTGAELLAIAREVLRKELLPLLPKGRQYDALMIANAMGIAERQLQAGDTPAQAETRELAVLLQMDTDQAGLERRLAQGLRNGEFDHRPEVQDLLWRLTVQRVRESAPRALALSGII
jgi:hypothetical protein